MSPPAAVSTGRRVAVLQEPAAVRAWSRRERAAGRRVALVPTMGALHAGHRALLRAAGEHADRVVASIFVNPAQFGPGEDLEHYPRTFEADRDACATSGVDVIYAPPSSAVYAGDHTTWVTEDVLARSMEGEQRPGHFRGVLTVVLKLFHVIEPDVAVFGQKDAQQALLVRRMVRDLDLPVEVRVEPTVRDADGLALSSRNVYLDAGQRRTALCLPRAVGAALDALRGGRATPQEAEARGRRVLEEAGVTVDYFRVVDLETLEAPGAATGDPLLIAGAVRVGATRLLDNATWPEDALAAGTARREKRP